MKTPFLCTTVALALFAVPWAHAQKFPEGTVVHYPPRGPLAALQKNQAPASLAQRKKQLHDVLEAIHQFKLKSHPEYASSIGDKRYDADLTNYSAEAWQQRLNQENAFMMQLAKIDTTGMSPAEKQSKARMMKKLIADQEASASRPWETPVTATSGLPFSLPRLPSKMRFQSVQDYDNYITRLNKVPTAFRQISDDILLGEQDANGPAPNVIRKVLAQVHAVVSRKPIDSPFARPLKEFPSSVSPSEQTRIRKALLAAISKKVFPAYKRFGHFLQSLNQPPQTPAPIKSKKSKSSTPKVHP